MNSSIGIIGSADGPTAIFVSGQMGISWLNIWGLIIVALLLIPNIIYAVKQKNRENKCTNKCMNILEQIGRYGSMFLMVFNIGLAEFGFSSAEAVNDFILVCLAAVFQKENILEADSTGNYTCWYFSVKRYNNAALFIGCICGYFWNRAFICH